MGVRRVSESDLAEVADILADGFADDPFYEWVFEGDEGALAAWLELIAELALAKGPADIADGACAVLWIPPGERVFGSAADAARAEELFARVLGARGAAVWEAFGEIGRHRPAEPPAAAHLLHIATRRERRGEGLGAAACASGLEQCDRNAWPAFLNSTTPRNHPFYERLGFSSIGEVDPGAGAPPIHPMWREPR
jgi:GNAT superfamily N-acetyltransferase